MGVNNSTFFRSFITSLTILFWIVLFPYKEVHATEESNLIVGEIIALGKVQMRVDGNQWIELSSTTMPIFYESMISTSDGRATITLSNNGLIELSEETDIYIQREGRYISINVNRGGLRFLFPSQSNILIKTPSALIGDRESYNVAVINNAAILIETNEKAGEVLVKDNGLSLINDLKGNLKVTPFGSKKAIVLDPGELIEIAQLEKELLPTPIPSIEPKEGSFWGWIPERGKWEEVKLRLAPVKPPTQAPPEGFGWGWDANQQRWCWVKVKDGNIVVMMGRFQDKLGNWYWKEITEPLTVPVEVVKKKKAAVAAAGISKGRILGGIAVIGAIAAGAAAGGGGGGGDVASPSS